MMNATLRELPDAGNPHVRLGTLVLAVLALTAMTVEAQDWECRYDVPASNHVASGTQTLATRLQIGNDQRFNKTGAGTWNVPQNLLDVFWPVTLKTVAGALQIGVGTDAGSDPGATTLPASITDKALLWVDAADPQASHLVGTGDEVTYWYDRREGSSVASPKHYYAYADPTYATGGSPVKGSYDGRDGVYFGGVKSEKLMIWYKPDGSKAEFANSDGHNRIAHFFAVHGVSNSWGCIYGSYDTNKSAWIVGSNTKEDLSTSTTKYFWDHEWMHAISGRAYLNGERLEPLKDVQRGVQLLDTTTPEAECFRGSATAFFADQSLSGVSSNSGDYLFEAICFTNVLTEAELVQVRVYLMRKWQIAGQKDIRTTLAPGTELVADTTSGVATNGANIAGSGTIVKKGTNDLVYRNFGGTAYEGYGKGAQNVETGTRFEGAIDIRSGSVEMLSQAAIGATAGTRVSSAAAINSERPKTSVASADAGLFAKDGEGDVLVNGLPAGTQRLKVEAGRLEIRNVASSPKMDGGGAFEVFVPNHSFEEGTDADFADGATNVLAKGRYGWYVEKDGDAKLIHFSKWGNGASAAMDGGTRYEWKFYTDPPDGDGVLCIGSGTYAETDVTIPAPGWYELAFRLSGRESCSTSRDTGRASLIGSSGTLEFGRYLYFLSYRTDWNEGHVQDVRYPYQNGYQRIVFRHYVSQAGSYRLRLANDSSGYAKVYDDIHLRRIADTPPDIAYLPNGTFEEATLIDRTDTSETDELSKVTKDTKVDGWTLTEPSGQNGTVAFVTPKMKDGYIIGSAFNDARGPGHGFVELRFKGTVTGTSAATTFTSATSGTFRVQADLACFHQTGASLKLTATVNGTAYDLGTLNPNHKLMRSCQWPNRLTLTKGDAVTLTFTFSRPDSYLGGIWMDDVGLTTRCLPVEGNLVKNGSFENLTSWSWIHNNWKVVQGAILRGDAEAGGDAFGQERVDGRYFIRFQRRNTDSPYALSIMYQDVTFPQEGVYRLSFYSHKRLTSGTSVGNTCPTFWWLADTTANTTNLLMRTANDTNKYTEHTTDFYVPKAGTFRLGITADPTGSGSNYYDASIDAVSVTHIGDLKPTEDFTKEMKISVASGAKLGVCFAGTNRVSQLVLGGKHVKGIVNATTHPDFITGTGSFDVRGHGMAVILR